MCAISATSCIFSHCKYDCVVHCIHTTIHWENRHVRCKQCSKQYSSYHCLGKHGVGLHTYTEYRQFGVNTQSLGPCLGGYGCLFCTSTTWQAKQTEKHDLWLFQFLACLFVLLLSDSKAELQLFRIPLTLAKMNKAKSILFPYMEVNVCTHWGYGYVICAFCNYVPV